MKLLKNFLLKKDQPKEEQKKDENNLEESLLDPSKISQTFDEEIKSDDESDSKLSNSKKVLKKKSKQKTKKKKRSSDSEEESSSSEEESSNSGSGEGSNSEDKKKKEILKDYNIVHPNNPGACFSHLVFKILGAFCYMFLGFILSSDMNVFLSIFACVLVDFWITKNISGRKLVGMRWWAYIDEDGETEYVYESFDFDVVHSRIDTSVFWWGIICNLIYWGIMLMINVFGFNFLYGLLTFIATSLNYMNINAYYNCRKAHQQKVGQVFENFKKDMKRQIIENMI